MTPRFLIYIRQSVTRDDPSDSLSDVRPGLPFAYVLYRGDADIHSLRDRFGGLPDFKCMSYLLNEFSAQLCTAGQLAFKSRSTILIGFISHVLKMASKKKVIWSDTRRIVASVANAHAFRNRPNLKFVSYSMRAYLLTIPRTHPIPAAIRCCRPLPAPFGLSNLGPESSDRIGNSTLFVFGKNAYIRARRIDGSALFAKTAHQFFAARREQVIRVDAPRIPASVANELAFRDRPNALLISKSMGKNQFSIPPEASMPVGQTRTSPLPARIGLNNLRPKQLVHNAIIAFQERVEIWP